MCLEFLAFRETGFGPMRVDSERFDTGFDTAVDEDKEALVAMVRAAYDAAHRLRKKEE